MPNFTRLAAVFVSVALCAGCAGQHDIDFKGKWVRNKATGREALCVVINAYWSGPAVHVRYHDGHSEDWYKAETELAELERKGGE